MRYFFDIHLNGQCHLDEHGQDFKSAEEHVTTSLPARASA